MSLTVRDNHPSVSNLVVKCSAGIGEAYWKATDAVVKVIGKPSYRQESLSTSNAGNLYK